MILSLLLAGSNALQAEGPHRGTIEFADASDEFRVVTADTAYEETAVMGAALECAAPEPACAAPAPAPSCCAPAPAPSCCAPAPAAPSCCAPAAAPSCCAPAAPSCCAPAPTCCEQPNCCQKRRCCLSGLGGHGGGFKFFNCCSRKKQCNACECDQCQQQASNPTFFSKMMELEKRKNAWLVETFIDRF